MATIDIRREGKILRDRTAVSAYLNRQGILYENWGVDRLDHGLRGSYPLPPERQRGILAHYGPEISVLKARQGYLTEDIVALSDATPDLDRVLEKFRREHHHADDEVRFVVDGSGVFTIRKGDLIFDVTVVAGDLLGVPAYTRHGFDLTAEKRITCIRIFKDPAGWIAIYDEPPPMSARRVEGPPVTDEALTILTEDHVELLAEAAELKRVFAGRDFPLNAEALGAVRNLLDQVIDRLESHGMREADWLFSVLEKKMDEGSRWQVRMMEIQDEMILTEAKCLRELVSGAPASIARDRLREGGMHLTRWIREHVEIEEKHLFPRLKDPPEEATDL